MSKDVLKEERMKVLELLSQGKISADEAEKLLDALGSTDNDQGTKINQPHLVDRNKSFRMLKIHVDSQDGDKVRIQIPVEFAKLLKKGKFNIDLDNYDIDIDMILELVQSGAVGEFVNVVTEDGDVVKIFIE